MDWSGHLGFLAFTSIVKIPGTPNVFFKSFYLASTLGNSVAIANDLGGSEGGHAEIEDKDVVPIATAGATGLPAGSKTSTRGWNLRHQLAEALSEQGSAYDQNPDSGQREVRLFFRQKSALERAWTVCMTECCNGGML